MTGRRTGGAAPNRNGGLYYNFAYVGFPQEHGSQNCLSCHIEGTYGADLAVGVLPTTVEITDGVNATADDISAMRDTVPNATDLVNSPTAAACYSCHASDPAEAHMEQNGGIIAEPRVDSGL